MSILNLTFLRRRQGSDRTPNDSPESESAANRLRQLLKADATASDGTGGPDEASVEIAAVATLEAVKKDASESIDSSVLSDAAAALAIGPELPLVREAERAGDGGTAVPGAFSDPSVELAQLRIEANQAAEQSRQRLAYLEGELESAIETYQSEIALRHAVELELARLTDEKAESERLVDRQQRQLETTADQVQVEAAGRRAAQLELSRLSKAPTRRPSSGTPLPRVWKDRLRLAEVPTTAKSSKPTAPGQIPPQAAAKRPTRSKLVEPRTTTHPTLTTA